MVNNNYNILKEDDKQISQPKFVKTDLMCHQKTMIHKMMEIEETGLITTKNYKNSNLGFSIGETKISTNFAILGDKVGSGKTLMVSSLISVKKLTKERDIEFGGSNYSSVKFKLDTPKLNCCLIIVPHKLLPQWTENFQKNITNLNVYSIAYNKEIDNVVKTVINKKKNGLGHDIEIRTEEIISDEINKYDVVIIGETMYKRFFRACQNYQWNRVFIDEADSIKLPRDMVCNFNFLWLITGTPTGLFYGDKPFISKLFNKSNSKISLDDFFVFKNDDNYIEQSIVLPHPKRLKIKCITPRELGIIIDVIPPSVLQMINAGNSEQAISALNCNVDTDENIIQVITKNLRESIKNKMIELEAEQKKYYPVGLQAEHEKKISMIQNQITKLEEKINDIKKKIYELNDCYCPVCMGEFSNPVITECCKSCFCFDCLAVSLGELKSNKCPNCRQPIHPEKMHLISDKKKEVVIDDKSKKYELKDKMDVLLDLIHNKPDGSFMIFANFAETFNKIELKLTEQNISYHILKGQAATVKKFIDDFREKKVKVLMLNAQFFGAGMNLQMTTDLVMYHRFRPEMEEQIIGRAQRLGRTTPLNVYYLLHDNESNDIADNFKFEDQGSVHYMDWLENNKDVKNITNETNEANELNGGKKLDELNDVYTIKMISSDEETYENITNDTNKEKTNTNKVVLVDDDNDNDNIKKPNKNIFIKNKKETKTENYQNEEDNDDLEELDKNIKTVNGKYVVVDDKEEIHIETYNNEEIDLDDFEEITM